MEDTVRHPQATISGDKEKRSVLGNNVHTGFLGAARSQAVHRPMWAGVACGARTWEVSNCSMLACVVAMCVFAACGWIGS